MKDISEVKVKALVVAVTLQLGQNVSVLVGLGSSG